MRASEVEAIDLPLPDDLTDRPLDGDVDTALNLLPRLGRSADRRES
jgi:hypothetical protein